MDTERITTITCPYCEQEIETGTRYELMQQRALSTHKARCPKKRYLGGELSMDNGSATDPF